MGNIGFSPSIIFSWLLVTLFSDILIFALVILNFGLYKYLIICLLLTNIKNFIFDPYKYFKNPIKCTSLCSNMEKLKRNFIR